MTVCSFCATAIDDLATYLFLNAVPKESKPVPVIIRKHLASESTLLPSLMATLMNQLLFASHANHWAVTRPILSLMLSQENIFVEYETNLLSTQTNENRIKLAEEFKKLSTDVQRSVEILNRDRFTQKLTLFRLAVRQFLTL